MKLKLALCAVAFVATPAAAQTVDCHQLGSNTRCTAQPAQPAPDYGALVDAARPVAPPPTVVSPAQTVDTAEGSKNRRAAAYNQVGALIADGRCDDANRLAAFYGHDDLIRDTAKACPLKAK